MPEMPGYEPARAVSGQEEASSFEPTPAIENEDDSKYIDLQEAELAHFEQQYASEMSAYDSAHAELQGVLGQLRPRLDYARRLLDEFRASEITQRSRVLASYKEARNEVRTAFKRMERHKDSGGPPLD